MENKNPFPLSHSRISAFDCGYYFANEYRKQIHEWLGLPFTEKQKPRAVGINAECGRFGHEVIAKYTEYLVKAKLQNDPEWLKGNLIDFWYDSPATSNFQNPGLPETERDDLESCLTRFAESHLFSPTQIYGVEMQLCFDQNGIKRNWHSPKAWFRGIIDLCETPDPETVIITDYKFNWAAQAKWELEKGLQGRIYAWLMSLVNPGAKAFIVKFDYVRKNIVVQLEYTREDCEKMGERIQRIADKVERAITDRGASLENWPASLCSNCAWCQWPCPLAQNSMQLWQAIKQREDAEQLAHLILMQKQTLEKNQAKLKEYLKEDKPVTVDGQMFGYHVTETESYDPAEVCRKLLKTEYDAFEVLKVDTYKLNAKKRAGIKEAIADLAEIKTSQRYGIKKQEGDNE